MSSINCVNGTNAIPNQNPTGAHRPYPGQVQRSSPGDRVELSGMSHLLSKLKSNDIRADKVANVKEQIASGKYEDDHKLDVAVDRLLDDLNR